MAKNKHIPISENHRRGIASTLGLLDEMLCRFERWMRAMPAEGVLFREVDTLTAQQRDAIQAEIDDLRKMLVDLRDDLRLETRTQNIASAIWSQSSSFWEAMVELGTKYLRRYGDMPDGFAEYFDPKVERMIEHMRRIGDMANRRVIDGVRRRRRSASEAIRDATKEETEG